MVDDHHPATTYRLNQPKLPWPSTRVSALNFGTFHLKSCTSVKSAPPKILEEDQLVFVFSVIMAITHEK